MFVSKALLRRRLCLLGVLPAWGCKNSGPSEKSFENPFPLVAVSSKHQCCHQNMLGEAPEPSLESPQDPWCFRRHSVDTAFHNWGRGQAWTGIMLVALDKEPFDLTQQLRMQHIRYFNLLFRLWVHSSRSHAEFIIEAQVRERKVLKYIYIADECWGQCPKYCCSADGEIRAEQSAFRSFLFIKIRIIFCLLKRLNAETLQAELKFTKQRQAEQMQATQGSAENLPH